MGIMNKLLGREYRGHMDTAENDISFEDIEIGEVFGFDGCYIVMQKISDNEAVCLADDFGIESVCGEVVSIYTYNMGRGYYVTQCGPQLIITTGRIDKLTPETQAHWKVK